MCTEPGVHPPELHVTTCDLLSPPVAFPAAVRGCLCVPERPGSCWSRKRLLSMLRAGFGVNVSSSPHSERCGVGQPPPGDPRAAPSPGALSSLRPRRARPPAPRPRPRCVAPRLVISAPTGAAPAPPRPTRTSQRASRWGVLAHAPSVSFLARSAGSFPGGRKHDAQVFPASSCLSAPPDSGRGSCHCYALCLRRPVCLR